MHKEAVENLFEMILQVNEVEDTHIDARHAVAIMRTLTDVSTVGKKFVMVILQSDELDTMFWGKAESKSTGVAEKIMPCRIECIENTMSYGAAALSNTVTADNFAFKEL